MRRLLPLSLLALMGCGLTHRGLKFAGPEQVVVKVQAQTRVLQAKIERKGEVIPAYAEEMMARDGTTLVRPIILRDEDKVILSTPREEPVSIRLYIRSNGLFDRHDFQQIYTVTGALERRYPNEIVELPDALLKPVRLAVRDLTNPYNNYDFDHDALLLVVAEAADGSRQRLLFKRRDSGVHINGFAGVLATIPLSQSQQSVAPILAIGPTFGWRTRKPSGPLMVFDPIELVISVGLGSTALDAVTGQENLGGQLGGFLDATVAGGGLRLFHILTVQGYVNTSQFFRDAEEAPFTLAAGVDATSLAAVMRDMFSKLLRKNKLQERYEE